MESAMANPLITLWWLVGDVGKQGSKPFWPECPAFPRIKDSGRTLRMALQLEIVTLSPTDYKEIQAEFCFLRGRILFCDLNLFHSSFS